MFLIYIKYYLETLWGIFSFIEKNMSVNQETALLENQASQNGSKTLTSTNITTNKSTIKVHTTIVKSTDGKFHQLNFDVNQNTLEFILLK